MSDEEHRSRTPNGVARSGQAPYLPTRESQTEVRAATIRRIKRMVDESDLGDGGRLPSERKLAKQLQVSRASLREALLALEILGFIEIRQRRGIFVRHDGGLGPASRSLPSGQVSPALAMDFFEIRLDLETRNAALAATRATEEDLAELARLTALLGDNDGDTPNPWYAGEADFHFAVARATHSEARIMVYTIVYELLYDLMLAVREGASSSMSRDKMRLFMDHQAILDAIRAGNPQEAEARMREHVHRAETALLRYFGLDG